MNRIKDKFQNLSLICKVNKKNLLVKGNNQKKKIKIFKRKCQSLIFKIKINYYKNKMKQCIILIKREQFKKELNKY